MNSHLRDDVTLPRAVDDYLPRTPHEAHVRQVAQEQTAKWAELLERLE